MAFNMGQVPLLIVTLCTILATLVACFLGWRQYGTTVFLHWLGFFAVIVLGFAPMVIVLIAAWFEIDKRRERRRLAHIHALLNDSIENMEMQTESIATQLLAMEMCRACEREIGNLLIRGEILQEELESLEPNIMIGIPAVVFFNALQRSIDVGSDYEALVGDELLVSSMFLQTDIGSNLVEDADTALFDAIAAARGALQALHLEASERAYVRKRLLNSLAECREHSLQSCVNHEREQALSEAVSVIVGLSLDIGRIGSFKARCYEVLAAAARARSPRTVNDVNVSNERL